MNKPAIFALTAFTLALLAPLKAQDRARPDAFHVILERGTVKIGISENYPPLNFDRGQKGLEIEMARELGAFMGVKVELVPLKLADYLPALEKGEIDLIIAGLSRNLPRARKIWFSEPYITITPAALVNKRVLPQTRFGDQFEEAPVRTIWDLRRFNGFKCAVKKGSSYEVLLGSRFPDIERILVEDNAGGLESIRRGTAQGFIHDSLYLQYLYRRDASLSGAFTLLSGGNVVEELCVGIPFGAPVLKNQVDVFIAEMKRQGHFSDWLEKYGKE